MKRIETILSQLGAKGVRFWLEGDALHYRAPKGTFNAETIQTLRLRKPEIITFLRRNVSENGTRTMLPPLVARGQTQSPLSLGQQSLWILDQMNGSNATYNVPEALLLRGPLDCNVLKSSLQLLIDRHSVLRSSIRESEENVYMHVAERLTVDIPLDDLREMNSKDRHLRALQIVKREANHTFNLLDCPLFKTCLVQLADQEHIFCFTMHHMIADGWSKGILSRELAIAYNANLKKEQPRLTPLSVHYNDFTHWQRVELTDQYLEPHIGYWKKTLKNLPSPASILTDRFRPTQPSGCGKVLSRELPPELTRAIKKIASETGCTLYMTLATIFSELLRRYRGDNDVVFGTPSANRPFNELNDLLGFFVNSLVIRVDTDGRLTFNELLARVRKITLDSFAHQIVPFEKVVEALGQRSQGFSPLFQIGFVLQDGTIEVPSLTGLQIEQIQVERTTAKYDLSLIAVETRDRIVLEWEYATDLFDDETICNIAQSFQQITAEAVKRPDEPLQSLNACTAKQRALVLDNWSSSKGRPLPDSCLHELFSCAAQKNPERIAVVCGDQRLTYRQLDESSDAIASHLQKAGCGPDTITAVCLDRSVDMIASIMAVLKSGSAYMPLDPDYPENRLRDVLDDSGAKVIIAHDIQQLSKCSGITRVDPDQISTATRSYFLKESSVGTNNLAYLIYTSGSTGTPKGVMIEHCSVVNLIAGLEETVYSRYKGPQQVSLFASTVFDASVQQIFAALCGGHTLHVLDSATREDYHLLLEYWQKESISVADGTPTLLRLLLEAGLTEKKGLSLRHLLIGGEPLSYETVRRLKIGSFAHNLTVTNVYGPTECCVDVTAFDCVLDALPELAVMPIGRPMVNTKTYILDEQGLPVPPGIIGELYLGGPGVGRGYLRRDDLTAERFIKNPFLKDERLYRTGDRVRYLSDGTIAFLGRTDDQIKVRGFRIEPGEIEHCLCQFTEVLDAVVCSVESKSSDYELVAYLVLDDEGVKLEHLYSFLVERLPHYMIPARFFMLPSFPKSASGKVDRSVIPSCESVALQKDRERHTKPQTEKEIILSSIWQDVLNIEAPGSHDNYFLLGGDSIKALQLVSRLRKQHYQIEIKDIFEYPTIGQQALLLTEQSVSCSNVPVIGRLPLTPIQSWFLKQFEKNMNHFHQAVLLRPRERFDDEALKKSVKALQIHHDLLRSRFFKENSGEWVQEIMDHSLPVKFEFIDLRNDDSPCDSMRNHSFLMMKRSDIEAGSLFAATLYRMEDGDRFLLTGHHLVVDGVSWRILLQDLHSVYPIILAGEKIDLETKTTSFKEWSECLAEYGLSLSSERSKFVENMAESFHGPKCFPYGNSSFTYAERRRHKRLLPLNLSTPLLTDAHQPYSTGITDLLVCAFGRAVQKEAGIDCIAITLEGHGRDAPFKDVKLDRTVGWFTVMSPLVIDYSSSGEVEENIRSVQRAVQQAKASAIDFGLRRWGVGNGSGDRHAPLPSILFNYLGDFDGALDSNVFDLATEEIGAVIDPDAVVPFSLEVTGMSLKGRIELSIEYGGHIEEMRIQMLMEYWVEELKAIVSHTLSVAEKGVEASDIDYAGLGVDEVNSFLNSFTGN